MPYTRGKITLELKHIPRGSLFSRPRRVLGRPTIPSDQLTVVATPERIRKEEEQARTANETTERQSADMVGCIARRKKCNLHCQAVLRSVKARRMARDWGRCGRYSAVSVQGCRLRNPSRSCVSCESLRPRSRKGYSNLKGVEMNS